MDMFDEAMAIRSTMQLCHLTQSELARQLGVSQSYVANKLRLLKFSPEMTEKIRKSGITERHARSLLRFDNEVDALRALEAVCERGMTVRECEAMVDSEVFKQMPYTIGRKGAADALGDLCQTVTRGCEILQSKGVNAKSRTSYFGEDMYITIVIKSV